MAFQAWSRPLHHATTFLDFPSAAERTATQVLTFLGNLNISEETEHGLALLSRGSWVRVPAGAPFGGRKRPKSCRSQEVLVDSVPATKPFPGESGKISLFELVVAHAAKSSIVMADA
jgi:hypothetical protein